MLYLRLDQAEELVSAARDLKERLVIRYMVYNGLSPMEVSDGRIENLDPVECTLFLPRRHWKRNCLAHIDAETVRLQIIYSGGRKSGPLIRSNKGGHLGRFGIWHLVRRVALRASLPNPRSISPRTLKRTFAREWLLSGGNIGSLQKQLSHKHLWSTAHYLQFVMEDILENHAKLMRRVKHDQATKRPRLVH